MTDEPTTPPVESAEQPTCTSKQKKPKSQAGRSPRKKWGMEQKRKALALISHGASTAETMAATGLTRTTVKRYRREIRAAFPELENLKTFRQHKIDVIDSVLLGSLKTMSDPNKHKDATLRDAAYAGKVAFEMGRLESGLSTANIATTFTKVVLPK